MRTLTARFTAAVCGLLVTFTAAMPSLLAQQPGAPKPLATVVLSSYDELLGDTDFIGSLGGLPKASQTIEQMVMSFTQQKGLAGLDKSKPLGLIVQSTNDMPGGAVCIPVTDLNALLDVVKAYGITAKDAGNGLMQVSTPQGQGAFLKKTQGWALLSLSPDMINAVPADPGAVLSPLAEQYDLAVQFHVQNLPEAYRQMAIQAMSEGAKQSLSQKADESDEAYKARQEQVNAQLAELQRFINELDQVTVGLSIDSKQQRAFMDFAYTALPNTKLAKDIAANNNATTNYAGFFQPDAAMTLSFASKMTGADAAQMDQMIASLRKQIEQSIDDDEDLSDDALKQEVKGAVNDFIDALKATLEAGVMDGGASLKISPDALTFVAGGFIADPSKVESGLKKLSEAAKKKHGQDMPEINWGAEKYKDVTFNTLQAPLPEDADEKAKQLFGDKIDIAVGIGEKSVYFALGKNSLEAVKKIIDDSAASPNKQVPPMELTVALAPIMNAAKSLADEDDKPQVEMVANMLTNEANGRDHVRMVAQPVENGVRMRIEAEEGVLRAIGMAAMQAQMRALGQ